MRLSEAIRLGAAMRPQAFHGYFSYSVSGERIASCALGAAADAVGIERPMTTNLDARFPVLASIQHEPCPACGQISGLDHVITHLNDWHTWSRERIADWVELFEGMVESKSNAMEEECVYPKP